MLMRWLFVSLALSLFLNCHSNSTTGQAVPGFGGQSILITSGNPTNDPDLMKLDHANTLVLHDLRALSGHHSWLGKWDGVQIEVAQRVTYGNHQVEVSVYGHTHNGQPAWAYKMQSGNFFSEADMEMRTNVVLLGETVAQKLFQNENSMGKVILIENNPYEVTGIVTADDQNIFKEDPGDYIMIPISNLLRNISESTHLRAAKIELLETHDLAAKLELLRLSLRDRHGLKFGANDDFKIQLLMRD